MLLHVAPEMTDKPYIAKIDDEFCLNLDANGPFYKMISYHKNPSHGFWGGAHLSYRSSMRC